MINVGLGAGSTPFDSSVVLEVADADAVDAQRLHREVLVTLGEEPRSVLCDLTAVRSVSGELLDVLRAIARQQVDWPGTPVGIACADPRLRGRLVRGSRGSNLVVGTSVEAVAAVLAGMSQADHATLSLEPGLTAPRTARAFVARTCLRWHARSVTGHACLVASELVTYAVLHADTPVQLTVSRCPGRLRIAVRDGESASDPWTTGRLSGSSRGLLLVSSVCRAWGVHPTAGEGRVVWAVLDIGPEPATSGPEPAAPGSSGFSG